MMYCLHVICLAIKRTLLFEGSMKMPICYVKLSGLKVNFN